MNSLPTFGQNVIRFNQSLKYNGTLPDSFGVLNPYLDNPETLMVMRQFYDKYYNDHKKRKFIIGINPSRNGAGVTGIPFTDTKRLQQFCGITMQSAYTHEVSSVFIYDIITAFGGVQSFYESFYINSPFPLALVRKAKNGNWLNANYYDSKELFSCVQDYMVETLKQHLKLGLDTSEVFVLGKKNAEFIASINQKHLLFGKINVLEHPRFIQQYKSKEKELYIDKYLRVLTR